MDDYTMTNAIVFLSRVHQRWIIRAICKAGKLGDFFAIGTDEPTDEELKKIFGPGIEITRPYWGDPEG